MKRILSLLLTFSMLLSLTLLIGCNNGNENPSNQQSAAKPASDGLELTLSEDQTYYTVTGIGSCRDTEIVIPSTYEGKPVKKIGDGAFKVTAATTAQYGRIPDRTYKNGYTLESESIPELAITSVILSTSITEIGDEAFYGCENLTTVETQVSMMTYAPAGSGSDLNSALGTTNGVTVSGTTVSGAVGSGSVAIVQMQISAAIHLIGADAFKNTAYYQNESNWSGGVLYLGSAIVASRDTLSGAVEIKEGTRLIASEVFRDNTAITQVKFPESLRVIGARAFMGCTGITALDLSIAGIYLDDEAFRGCTALAEIKVGNDTEPTKSEDGKNPSYNIVPGTNGNFVINGNASFVTGSGFTNLTSNIVFSTYLEDAVFADCTSLTSVSFGKNTRHFGKDVFMGCTALATVDLSNLTATNAKSEPIRFPAGITYTTTSLEGMFRGCTSLTSVKLPQNIEFLKETFVGCSSLTAFVVPGTVKTLTATFKDCTALTDLTLSEGLTDLKQATFAGCSSLTSIYLPDTLVYIGQETFRGLPTDATVSLNRSIAQIEVDAFWQLVAITYRGTIKDWSAVNVNVDANLYPFPVVHCTDGTVGE